jgi:hypothetical protein
MTIPPAVNRIVVVGHLGTGEIFNTGFWTFGDVPTSDAEASAFAAAARDAFQSAGQAALEFYLAPTSGFDEIRTYHYPDGGPSATFLGVAEVVAGAGTGTEADLPFQMCAVSTLKTGLPGRRRRGRMYWPVNRRDLADHQLDQPDTGNLSGAIGGFLNAINSATGLGVVSVVSQIGTGSSQPVNSITVDSRLDVQRRRAADQTALFESDLAIT